MPILYFIQNQILFYIAIIIILFIPGYFLLLAIFGRSEKQINKFERFIISFGLSLITVNFIAFIYSKLNIPITAISSILGVLFFSLVCFGIYLYYHSREGGNPVLKSKVSTLDSRLRGNDKDNLFNFSKNQSILIFLLLFLTLFIKTAYLTGTVAPTATDMGHHLYWAKQMSETNQLPNYEGMPDFIIGEHIVLSELAMISNADFFGAFPIIFLLLFNILSVLIVFILTLRIFKNRTIAILTLLFLGVLFTISSPQAKFVSGGVFGNILGNFLMPLAFYFYFRAFQFLNTDYGSSTPIMEFELPYFKSFLSLGIFITLGLFYTHHLTSFIFIFSFIFLIISYLILNYKNFFNIFKKSSNIVFSTPVILTFLTGLIFLFFVFTPNYLSSNAVETAVGAPSKSTRIGLSLNNLKSSVGEARLALGFVGFLLLVLNYKRKDFGFAIICAWTAMLFIMSTKPNWLFIDLPSNRIGNYLGYPLAILSAYGFYTIFKPTFSTLKKIDIKNSLKNTIPANLIFSAFLILTTFVLTNGLLDNAQSFKKSSDFTPLVETFDASAYLKKNVDEKDIILKDHNYITGDSWIKLFFMQGYKYPQSRGYFKRYQDPTKPREMCTLYMISNPTSPKARLCFSKTKTNFILINPTRDSSQFRKLKNFNKVYTNTDVAIYYKK